MSLCLCTQVPPPTSPAWWVPLGQPKCYLSHEVFPDNWLLLPSLALPSALSAHSSLLDHEFLKLRDCVLLVIEYPQLAQGLKETQAQGMPFCGMSKVQPNNWARFQSKRGIVLLSGASPASNALPSSMTFHMTNLEVGGGSKGLGGLKGFVFSLVHPMHIFSNNKRTWAIDTLSQSLSLSSKYWVLTSGPLKYINFIDMKSSPAIPMKWLLLTKPHLELFFWCLPNDHLLFFPISTSKPSVSGRPLLYKKVPTCISGEWRDSVTGRMNVLRA